MPIQRLPLGPGLGDDSVQSIAHIGSDILHTLSLPTAQAASSQGREKQETNLVPVLIQTQCAARVLDEQVQQPHLVRPDLGQLLEDRVGDEVGAAGARGEREVFLGPHGFACPGEDGALLVGLGGGEEQAQREGPEEVEEGWEEGEDY